jgi:TonB-dependent SusC/RagA subfamily outer membrane receptor
MRPKNILALIIMMGMVQLTSGQNTEKSEKKITITGFVLNKDNTPVKGAIFYIDSLKTGYKSRKNGSFKLKVNPAARKLMVRSSTYGFSETDINKQTTINFTLNGIADNQPFGSSVKGNEGGPSVSGNIPPKPRAKKMNTYSDIYQMIRGEVSGVVVSGKSVLIQQGHSFFGSSEPLYVVNGVIVVSIDFISPLDVKSITILKGSSAAIYGVRGANGVISITLRSGSDKEK